MAGLNVGLGCGLGTETGVLLTGGCCFFLSESWGIDKATRINICVHLLDLNENNHLIAYGAETICGWITIEAATGAAHGLHWVRFTFHGWLKRLCGSVRSISCLFDLLYFPTLLLLSPSEVSSASCCGSDSFPSCSQSWKRAISNWQRATSDLQLATSNCWSAVVFAGLVLTVV